MQQGRIVNGDQRADMGQVQKQNTTGLSSTTQEGNDFTFKNYEDDSKKVRIR